MLDTATATGRACDSSASSRESISRSQRSGVRLEGIDDEDLERALHDDAEPPQDSAIDYVRSVLGVGRPQRPGQPAPMPAPSAAPANLASRSQWERISLSPDVELHIRRPLSRLSNKRVERLITIARDLLEEDQP